MTSVTVGYWGIRGLGAPLRMMVLYRADSGVQLNAVNYDLLPKEGGGFDASSWFSKKPELKEKNPLMNLPYVIFHQNPDHENDIIVAQSNACLTFLGRKLGFMGSNELENIRCEELLCEIMDLRNKMVDFAYGGSTDPAGGTKLFNDVKGIINKLELCLVHNISHGADGTYLVGHQASAPDFHLWEMLDQFALLSSSWGLPSITLDHPLLSEFHRKFAADPKNRLYFDSSLARLPCNNLMAVFGSSPDGSQWGPDSVVTWRGTSGVYGTSS